MPGGDPSPDNKYQPSYQSPKGGQSAQPKTPAAPKPKSSGSSGHSGGGHEGPSYTPSEAMPLTPDRNWRDDRLAMTYRPRVQDNMTVQGQLDKILDENGELMQAASRRGQQVANSRGLLNSSIASNASMGAMLEAAVPIAVQDATTHFNQGINSQNAVNNMNLALLDGHTRERLTRIDGDIRLAVAQISGQYSLAGVHAQVAGALTQQTNDHAFQINTDPSLSPGQQNHATNIITNGTARASNWQNV